MDDAELMRRFEDMSLPFDQWRHVTHIRVAWNYLTRFPYLDALERIRAGIKAYNAANNVPEAELFGFHETITEAWMRIVSDLITRYGACSDSEAFLKEVPHVNSRTLLRCFYSRERLVTPQAKQCFVSPDRAPLPPAPRADTAPGASVRGADSRDLDALFALNPGLARDDHGTARTLRALAEGTLLAACEDCRVVGYVMMDYHFFDRAFIDYLVVATASRRRGHGLALVRTALALADSRQVFTSTNRSNAPLQALLRKVGFKPCGEVDQLDPGDPELSFVFNKESR